MVSHPFKLPDQHLQRRVVEHQVFGDRLDGEELHRQLRDGVFVVVLVFMVIVEDDLVVLRRGRRGKGVRVNLQTTARVAAARHRLRRLTRM